MPRLGMTAKVLTLTAAAPINAGIGYGVGELAGIDEGWKRATIAELATLLETGALAAFKPSRDLWWAVLTGGSIGAMALLAQPSIKKWWAERAAKIAAQPAALPTPTPTPTLPPPPVTTPLTPLQIAQQVAAQLAATAPKQRPPTTMEQLTPVMTTLISEGFKFGGLMASKGTYRNIRAAGMNYHQASAAGMTYQNRPMRIFDLKDN